MADSKPQFSIGGEIESMFRPGTASFMNPTVSPKDFPWKRSRSGYAVFFFFSILVACFLLRLALFFRFGWSQKTSFMTLVELFFNGFHRDFLAALFTTLPLLLWFWLFPEKWFSGMGFRILFILGFFVFWTAALFLLFTEYFFFKEFHARFNMVAVDYLLYPTEIPANLHELYPFKTAAVICSILSLIWCITAFRYFRQMWYQPVTWASRFMNFFGCTGLFIATWLTLNPPGSAFLDNFKDWNAFSSWVTTTLRAVHFSEDRVFNEIANNGEVSLVNAVLTRNLDYGLYYKTIDPDEAYNRTRQMLTATNAQFVATGRSIRRNMAGDAARPKLNVVILLAESLGSEYMGCLGSTNSLTPEMDKLATKEGLLFSDIYACGNQTVRGYEGVLSSFPPLPGDSIVKRDRSDNVETIARVLKRDGYTTVFFYGSRGVFNGVRSYATRNGWDRFLEHNPPFHDDFPHPKFATMWGVCDEEVYDRAIQEFRALNDAGKPFFGTIMSVSNHKPYTYPRGRILDDPDKPRDRNKAIKYADWSLGHFFDIARREAFWTNTIFVVVADHGAQVYRSEEIPMRSYEIPLVILGPAVVSQPKRIDTLGSSLDVSPTVLGLIGRPYESMFFGRDLLHDPPANGRALVNHNRDIAVCANSRMAVLGLESTIDFYQKDPKTGEFKPAAKETPPYTELEKNAAAIYQVADDLYMNESYQIDGTPANEAPPPGAKKPEKSGKAKPAPPSSN